jgi:hypothetical protein
VGDHEVDARVAQRQVVHRRPDEGAPAVQARGWPRWWCCCT